MRKIIYIVLTVLASAWLMWWIDDGLENGWPAVTLHNWEEFGLGAMHGKLVMNPGGFEALSQPEIYFGMSPLFLYPVYFCAKVFAWTGLGALPFHIFLAVLVAWGIWHLLGRNNGALLAAALVILSPGYGRYQKSIDPNAISVLAGLPYMALATYLLKKARPQVWHYVCLALATVVFVPLNWTTAWVLAPFGVFLLVNAEVRRRPTLVYLTLTAIGSVCLVYFSMAAKHAGDATQGVAAAAAAAATAAGRSPGMQFLGSYTWGNYGYYEGLSSFRFLLRLFTVNVAGLLALLCWWAWRTLPCMVKQPVRGWLSLLPLAMALIELVGMRNYFCHHPWMGAPVAIVGLVLSLALQSSGAGVEQPGEPERLRWPAMAATACAFLYGLAVVLGLHANNSATLGLEHFVRAEVPRGTSLVLVKSIDPATAEIAESLPNNLDRHIVVVDTLAEVPQGYPLLVLSSRPIEGLTVFVQRDTDVSYGAMSKAAAWFNSKIARRGALDKVQVAPHFYLYRSGGPG